MRFICKNVALLWPIRFNVTLKNVIINIFIAILLKNLISSTCILVSPKEGSNNYSKYFLSDNFIKFRSTHLTNNYTNTHKRQSVQRDRTNRNRNRSIHTLKSEDSKHLCYISNSYETIAIHTNKLKDSSRLLPSIDLNEDNLNEYGSIQLDSTITYPLQPIFQESCYTNNCNSGLEGSPNPETPQISSAKYPVKSVESVRVHSLSDIDIGLIKKVDCNRVIDVKAVFDEEFEDELPEIYGLYKEKLLKLLAKELEQGGYRNAIDLLYNRWKNMDIVAISRGFRILLTEQWRGERFDKLVQTLISMIPARFVVDISSFEIAMRAINRSYIDGWVLSLTLISIMRSFGIEYFKRVCAFSDFKSALDGDVFKNAKSCFKRNLGYELHDSKKNRQESMDSMYNSAIYSCFNSRKFTILTSLYYEKLCTNKLFNTDLDTSYKLDLKEEMKRQLLEFSGDSELEGGNGFDELISRSLSLIPEIDVSYDLEKIQNELVSLKSLDISELKPSDWSIYLILKHSLSNIFSTTEILVPNPSSNAQSSGSELSSIESNKLESTWINGLKEEWKNLGDDDLKLKQLLKARTDMDNLLHYTKDIYSIISDKTFFEKNTGHNSGMRGKSSKASTNPNSKGLLESTIHYIRQVEASGHIMTVKDVYEFMRLLLRYKISGATALNMIFMLVPSLVFSNWSHYHIFTCCLEHDFERGDLDSIDELLQYMIKLKCKADPGLYERFFRMCNALDKPLFVLKHFKIMTEHGINWEEKDRYTSEARIKISFGLYEQIFLSTLKTGNVKCGMKALKHLIGALKGTYKLIPTSIWKTFMKLIELTQVDKSLLAILDQFCKAPSSEDMKAGKPVYLEIPKQKSVIIKQIEEILNNYINSD